MKILLNFIIIILLTIQFTIATIIINEIELNPSGSDKGNEWIELYSTEFLDLKNYTLKNNDNQTITLNQTIQDYLIIQFPKQWLDNSDEKIFLISNNTIIHETQILKDSKNDNTTLQYCEGDYIFKQQTKNIKNNCNKIQEETIATPKETLKQQNIQPKQNQTITKPPEKIIQLTTSKTYNSQSEDIKTQENIIYKSKNELIKQYSVYGFAILCAILCVLLALNKLN